MNWWMRFFMNTSKNAEGILEKKELWEYEVWNNSYGIF